ncbi:MAG TPA: NUDIX hydrolase [Actinomycetota bacterium]|nr:NUDIX hydrolase [Actinomycetota bacterium]
MASTIRAAGVVLLREGRRGTEVCVLHRPGHNDWSLPKGKVDAGETLPMTARRETLEETGSDVVLGAPLPGQRYRVEGRQKTVDYWVGRIRAGGGGFRPNREIDKMEWLPPARAKVKLSYPRDRALVDIACAAPLTSPLIILRHTEATKRADFKGKDDRRRPLTSRGRAQAKDLVESLMAFGVESVHSSDAARCLQTVAPLARSIGTRVIAEELFSEESFRKRPKTALRRLLTLARDPEPMVICTHRPVLPSALEALADYFSFSGRQVRATKPLAPGSFVVLHRTLGSRGRPTSAVAGLERFDL